MSPVTLPGQAAGGHPDIAIADVGRQGLQHVEDVQVQGACHLGVVAAQIEMRPPPQVRPRLFVAGEQILERPGVSQPIERRAAGIRDGVVQRRDQRRDLLHGDAAARGGRDLDEVVHPVGPLDGVPPRGHRFPVDEHPAAGRDGDMTLRLCGPGADPHGSGTVGAGLRIGEMLSRQIVFSGDVAVLHRTVDPGADLQATGPVDRCDRPFQRGEMRGSDVDQTLLDDAGGAAIGVGHGEAPVQDPASQIESLVVGVDCRFGQVEPVPAGRPKRQRQPVGQVDQALVFLLVVLHLRHEPVVVTGRVGARIVDPIGARLRCGAAGGEHPVAERAQGLTVALVDGHETREPELPLRGRAIRRGAHGACPGVQWCVHCSVDQVQPVMSGWSSPWVRVQARAVKRRSTMSWRSSAARSPNSGTRSTTSITRW